MPIGQSVRKIKKSELQKSEYSSSLSTDDYFYFYECNYPSLPFTVKYEWEVKCNNGLIGYPPFIPLADFNQGVEKATYRIELPAGQGCRYRELNTQGKGIEVKESTGANGQQVIEATASKLSPIIKEPFGPDFTELFPRVYFAPSAFKYDKSEGDMSNWQKYGEWQYRLLDGRDLLTEPFRAKLHELTAQLHYRPGQGESNLRLSGQNHPLREHPTRHRRFTAHCRRRCLPHGIRRL